MRRGAAPGLPAALAVVALVRLGLKALGFRRTVRLAGRLARQRPGPPRGQPEECARAIATAAAFFPGRAVCLEQALALFVVLRRRGHPAELRVGVQPFPFQAHAWIELGGQPLFEPDVTGDKFVAFPGALA